MSESSPAKQQTPDNSQHDALGTQHYFSGMRGFSLIWLGQLVSMLGSAMTRFALTIWAWELTGEATALALLAFFSFTPAVLLSPLAGALVDRWNRKLTMMLSDLAAGVSTIVVLVLFLTGELQIWHLFITAAFASAFESFQFPAYSSAVTMMLPKKHYTRATAMISMAESASGIAAPALAAFLLVLIGIGGVLVVDVVTFVFAVVSLLVVVIPKAPTSEEGEAARGSLWQEMVYGFRYIKKRPSLLSIQLMFFVLNFAFAAWLTLLPALLLARTGNNELVYGTVQSMIGVGGVVGGVVLMVWGGPQRRIHGLLLGFFFTSLFGFFAMGLGRGVVVWSIGGFCAFFAVQFVNASNQAIWQSKVPPDVQGRVFSVRRLIAQITFPLATLVVGPLADYVFEPGMMPGGFLVPAFGGIVGTGAGAGMALLLLLLGVVAVSFSLFGYTVRVIRDVETILPDHAAVGTA